MGYSSYSHDSRSARTLNFRSKSFDDTFEQQRKRQIHPDMDPKGIRLRESRDSELHPNATPIILGLDITGSMQMIPHELIKEGLPKMVSRLQELGISSPAILFQGIGDSKCDYYPFQIGQFESGDKEMDLWLTRTYVEGNGGGNGGESYIWAWYFAANHIQTDAWDKRGEKGFLFTIGNEPPHEQLTSSEFRGVMGIDHETVSMEDLYKKASERWHIFHLCVNNREDACPKWKSFLGENAIPVTDYRKIPEVVAGIVAKMPKKASPITETNATPDVKITL